MANKVAFATFFVCDPFISQQKHASYTRHLAVPQKKVKDDFEIYLGFPLS
jgi:hypothetical protein